MDVNGGSMLMKLTFTTPASNRNVNQPTRINTCTAAATELKMTNFIISGVEVDFLAPVISLTA